jgi:exodeoxyribonuclease VII large subunit
MTGFLWGNQSDAFFEGAPNHKKGERDSSPGSEQENPLTVTQVNAWIKRTLERGLSTFWLAGEIGSITRSGAGHVYLTLKDDSNQISAVIWKSTWEKCRFEIHEGLAVLCMGKIDVYGPRGAYQVVVQKIEPQGVGALQIAFRKLHAKLEAEGLFRPDRKRPLPNFPTRIGFVTSPHGAAIHDFLEVLRRRWPSTDVMVIPAKVQGAGAAEQIARGIELAGRIRPAFDVLIVGRGGGSIEDLWCFNEEVVVRALAASPIPTVSAVGHEIDVTLSDLAADVRALTPSEAAERVVPNRDELSDLLHNVRHRLRTLLLHKVRDSETQLRGITTRPVMESPNQMFDTLAQKLDDIERRLKEGSARKMESIERAFEYASARLESLSPIRTLARGYSFTTDEKTGRVLMTASDVQTGQIIQTKFAAGSVHSQVLSVQPQASAARANHT